MADIPQSASSGLAVADVSAFAKDPPASTVPLVIDNGKVRRNKTTPLNTGPQVTRFVGTDYTTVDDDRVIIATAPLTISLIAAASFKYQRLDIKSRAAGTVTIDPNGSELIDGDLTTELTSINESLSLISDGLQWFTVGGGVGSGGVGFVVTETDLTDADNYYYGGVTGSVWAINRYDRPGGTNLVTATQSNNPSYTTLAGAWPNRTTLTYA